MPTDRRSSGGINQSRAREEVAADRGECFGRLTMRVTVRFLTGTVLTGPVIERMHPLQRDEAVPFAISRLERYAVVSGRGLGKAPGI